MCKRPELKLALGQLFNYPQFVADCHHGPQLLTTAIIAFLLKRLMFTTA